MSLIFELPSMTSADEFVAAVKTRFGVEAQIFTTNDDAQEHDPFPWVLNPPIVHVDRGYGGGMYPGGGAESEVEALVLEFGGTFVGP